jgi:hypothetical protein
VVSPWMIPVSFITLINKFCFLFSLFNGEFVIFIVMFIIATFNFTHLFKTSKYARALLWEAI